MESTAGVNPLTLAATRVAAVRDDPAARLALMAWVFGGPTGDARRLVPLRCCYCNECVKSMHNLVTAMATYNRQCAHTTT